jgi:hypothetical protein
LAAISGAAGRIFCALLNDEKANDPIINAAEKSHFFAIVCTPLFCELRLLV